MRSKRILHIVLLALMIMPLQVFGQVGLAFKRIGLGPRQAGMATAYTGGLDDAYSLYYNPAGLAHGRRWQLAGSYTKWFADTQYSSVVGVKQYEVLGSKKSTLGIGVNYMGMPEWDSTNGIMAPVSAASYSFTIAAAQRLDWINWPKKGLGKHFALGINTEILYNDWAGYSAFGATLTGGVTYKSERIELSKDPHYFFQYGVGLAYKNLNLLKPKFDTQKTDIPQNLAIGTSLAVGNHHGLSLLMNIDAGKYKDEDVFVLAGTELWIRNIIGVRAGYEFAHDLGDGFSMGASLRIPVAKNFDARLDFAQTEFGDVLNQTYRGGIAAFPSNPERFGMIFPENRRQVSTQVDMKWEASEDPDQFDIINYYVIVDPNKDKVQKALDVCKSSYKEFYNQFYLPRVRMYSDLIDTTAQDLQTVPELLINNVDIPEVRKLLDSLLICFKTTQLYANKIDLGLDPHKNYYWSVIAADLDDHIKVAHGSGEIREFTVIRPYLTITDIYLEPIAEITTIDNAMQGTVKMTVANNGRVATPYYSVDVFAALVDAGFDQDMLVQDNRQHLFSTVIVPPLNPGQSETLILKENWQTKEMGEYKFYANATTADAAPDPDMLERAQKFASIYTVPKWNGPSVDIAFSDSFRVRTNRYESVEVPVLPWVFFDANSTQIRENVDSKVAPLQIIAKRLASHPDLKICLKGYLDTTRVALNGRALYGKSDDNNPNLAIKRALAVKTFLLKKGVKSNQVEIVKAGFDPYAQRLLSKNIQNVISHEYINNENRRVRIEISPDVENTCEAEWALFKPNPVPIKRSFEEGVLPEFNIEVLDAAQVATWEVVIVNPQNNKTITTISAESLIIPDDSTGITSISSSLAHTVCWKNVLFEASENGLSELECFIRVVDIIPNSRREFKTLSEKFTIFETEQTLMDRIFTMYVFDDTTPVTPCVYGARLIEPLLDDIQAKIDAGDKIKIVFEGHTDIIGTIGRNLELSNQRGAGLKKEFAATVQIRDAKELADAINSALAMGYAYIRPLTIELDGNKSLIIGDNSNPLGRNFNRRSEIKVIKINE